MAIAAEAKHLGRPAGTKDLTNRSSQPLAAEMTRFNFMKQVVMFAMLAPASGGSAPSR